MRCTQRPSEYRRGRTIIPAVVAPIGARFDVWFGTRFAVWFVTRLATRQHGRRHGQSDDRHLVAYRASTFRCRFVRDCPDVLRPFSFRE